MTVTALQPGDMIVARGFKNQEQIRNLNERFGPKLPVGVSLICLPPDLEIQIIRGTQPPSSPSTESTPPILSEERIVSALQRMARDFHRTDAEVQEVFNRLSPDFRGQHESHLSATRLALRKQAEGDPPSTIPNFSPPWTDRDDADATSLLMRSCDHQNKPLGSDLIRAVLLATKQASAGSRPTFWILLKHAINQIAKGTYSADPLASPADPEAKLATTNLTRPEHAGLAPNFYNLQCAPVIDRLHRTTPVNEDDLWTALKHIQDAPPTQAGFHPSPELACRILEAAALAAETTGRNVLEKIHDTIALYWQPSRGTKPAATHPNEAHLARIQREYRDGPEPSSTGTEAEPDLFAILRQTLHSRRFTPAAAETLRRHFNSLLSERTTLPV